MSNRRNNSQQNAAREYDDDNDRESFESFESFKSFKSFNSRGNEGHPHARLSAGFDAGREDYSYQPGIGGKGADVLVGGAARDYLWGLAGDDKIAARGENDIAYGDSGDDIITGGAGADRLEGGKGNDRVFGGDDADMVAGGPGNDYLDEGKGHGDVEGGPGNDILIGGTGPDAFGFDRMSGNDVIRDFTAGPGMFDHLALRDLRWEDLRIADTSAGAKVSWDGGSVVLQGVRKAQLAQDDFMFANAPDLPPGARDVNGPAPERGTSSSDGPGVNGEPLAAGNAGKALEPGEIGFTFQGDETYRAAVGTSGADVLNGGAAWDHLFGRDGDDRLSGMGGNDVLQGDAGNDRLFGGDGMDRLDGGMGNDRLFGGDMADDVMGMDGADYIDGGPGHDMIEGGAGNDTLRGGTGADAFIVDPMSGNDVVLDMEVRGQAQGAFDHLALRDILPEQVSVRNTSRGALVSWNTDSDPGAEGSVLLQDVFKADLRQSDFMFVNAPGFVAGIEDQGSWMVFA